MSDDLPTPQKRRARVTAKEHLGGQVIRLRVAPEGEGPFEYLPGQYLRLYLADFEPRDYSIASGPDEAELEFHIRVQGEGGASSYIAEELAPGDSLGLEGPFGACVLERAHGGPILGIAGGTGLAPVLAILKQALAEGHEAPVRLFYGARRAADIYLLSEFNYLSQAYDNFAFSISLMEGAEELPGASEGLATDLLTADAIPGDALAYLAGPPAMIEAAVEKLRAMNLPEERIHADAFTLGPAQPQPSDAG